MTLTRRLISVIACAVILSCAPVGSARAGFFGSDGEKSGLDFERGYDINTVRTMTGRAVSQPRAAEKGYVIVELKSGNETLQVSVGPGSYWEGKGITINPNDELSVKGSKAQGKDGKSYILAQKLLNRTSGAQLELRNDKGVAAWSGNTASSTDSMRSQGGSMMRGSGGGMMRGGGGGMMRR